MIMAIKGTRMAAATELLLDAKLYPGLSLLGSKLSGRKRDETLRLCFGITSVQCDFSSRHYNQNQKNYTTKGH